MRSKLTRHCSIVAAFALLASALGCHDPAPTPKDDKKGDLNIKVDGRGTDITTPNVDVKVKKDGG